MVDAGCSNIRWGVGWGQRLRKKYIFWLVAKFFKDDIGCEIFLVNPVVAVGEFWLGCAFHNLFHCRLEKVSNGGCPETQFSCLLFVYFSLVAVWVIHSQMEVIQIHGWHEFFIICIFFLMAAQMFNSSPDWVFNIPWWLTVPLAQPKLAAKFDIGW